jgi:hypothetical protein
MKKEDGWESNFDWRHYLNHDSVSAYKLMVEGDPEIQGVVAFEIMENHVFMHLVESAPHNRGRDREFFRVGQHLYAFACYWSRQLGFDGCIAFKAKTGLIDYNIQSMNAKLVSFKSGRMIIDEIDAERLIQLYLEDKGGGLNV